MFREGHYLEVIKAADGCVATAIINVKEKTVEYKKKKMTTNKWLELQDWTSLYSIIKRAIIRNYEQAKSLNGMESRERKKTTSTMDVKYKFEASKDGISLPTIRVSVSAGRKVPESAIRKSKSDERSFKVEEYKPTSKFDDCKDVNSDDNNLLMGNYTVEEYVPPALPSSKNKANSQLKYVPSRKSMLLGMRLNEDTDENKYTPISPMNYNASSPTHKSHTTEVTYIPNSVTSFSSFVDETYDPCGASALSSDLCEAYVPSSITRTPVEEYQPDFTSKTMKFDDSYVPSSTIVNHRSSKTKNGQSSKKRVKTSSRNTRESKKVKSSSNCNRSIVSNVVTRVL